jgi:hypothetical protein
MERETEMVRGVVTMSHAAGFSHHRIEESNSVAGRGEAGVSDRAGAALWALDHMFTLAHDGAIGVNFHIANGDSRGPFAFYNAIDASVDAGGNFTTTPKPVYYAMLLFARYAAGGLGLPVDLSGPAASDKTFNVKAWATRGDDGKTRVIVINKSTNDGGGKIIISPTRKTRRPAELRVLHSTSGLHSGAGVAIQGETMRPDGTAPAFAPQLIAPDGNGDYRVELPHASAAVLVF